MTGEVQKKGMSKGCLIAIIVVAAVLLVVIIAGVTCYLKKDELARYGAVTMVNQIAVKLNNEPVEGIDTVTVNAVTAGFVQRINESELDYDKYGEFFKTIQAMHSDDKIDSTEAVLFMQAMIDYYPELEDLIPETEEEDSTYLEDTTYME